MLSAKGKKLYDLRLRHQGTNGNGIGIPAAPSIADIDRDGKLEIVVTTFDHGIDVYRVPRSNTKSPAVADRPRQPPAQRRALAAAFLSPANFPSGQNDSGPPKRARGTLSQRSLMRGARHQPQPVLLPQLEHV